LAIAAAIAAGCGVKGKLDKPPEAEYKRTYPTR
jgi:predicted small lipoprotein YifL